MNRLVVTSVVGLVVSSVVGLVLLAAPVLAQEKLQVEIKFATTLENRKPVDAKDTFEPSKVYCWNHVQGGSGEFQIFHLWYHNDKRIRKQPIQVRGKSWITWSYHNVKRGNWKVEVTDSEGNVIGSGTFTVK